MIAPPATTKDFRLVSIVGFLFGLFLLPILENVKPAFWELNLRNASIVVIGFIFFANLALWIGSLIGRRFPWVWQFSKYGATGSMAAATNFGILNLFSLATGIFSGLFIIIFNIIAFFITITNAYFWHKFWSFGQNSRPHLTQFSHYVGVTILSAGLDSLIVYLLTTFVGAPGDISPALWENISKVIAAVPVVAANFISFKFFIFRPEKTD